MAKTGFAFGEYLLDPDAGTLFRQGVPVPIPYRALLLLTVLVQREGSVASKSELLQAAWPDSVVEETNLSTQIAALRKILGQSSNGTDYILTVHRVGYRFSEVPERRSLTPNSHAEPPSSQGPAIAVLSFQNLSDDQEQQYFADGLAEDIITRLSRMSWLFVASRNSSFTYQGRAVDLKQVGRELGVRHVLAGSVQSAGRRLRVSAQLNDAESGGTVWAHRYESELSDFFTLQDEISTSVLAAIEPELYKAEYRRLRNRPPDSLDAWGFVMRAMPLFWTWGSQQEIKAAQALLQRAVEIDPAYPRANSLLGWTYAAYGHLGWESPENMLASAKSLVARGLELGPDDAWTHFASGYVDMVGRQFAAARDAMCRALEMNPSLALAHVLLASTLGYGGKGEEGLSHIRRFFNISPRDYNQAAAYSTAGICHFVEGRYAEAVAAEQRAVQLRPHFVTAWRTLAAAATHLGEMEIARDALVRSQRLQPSLTCSWVEKYHPIVQPDLRSAYVDGLRRAGLAE